MSKELNRILFASGADPNSPELKWWWKSNATDELKKKYLIDHDLMEAPAEEVAVVEEEESPKIKKFTGNREIAKNIWGTLTQHNLTQSSFEDWLKNSKNSPNIRYNVHDFLVERGYTQNDFNGWSQNVFGDTVQEELIEPDLTIDSLIKNQKVDVFGMPIPIQSEVNEEEEEDNGLKYADQINNITTQLNNLLKQPVLNKDGTVNREATIEQRNSIIDSYPDGTEYAGHKLVDGELRPITAEDIDLETPFEEIVSVTPEETDVAMETKWEGGLPLPWNKKAGYKKVETKESKAAKLKAIDDAQQKTLNQHVNMLRNRYGDYGFKFKSTYTPKQAKGMGYGVHDIESKSTMTIEGPTGETLTFDFNEFNEQEIKDFIKGNQVHKTQAQIDKEKEAYELWKKGELDLPTTCDEDDKTKCKDKITLDKIARPSQAALDYLRLNAPDIEDIPEDNMDAFQKVFSDTLNKATSSDPRMKFITENIQKEVFSQADAKSLEISKKYDTTTQEGLELATNEFKKWYNTEFQTKLKDNKQAKKLFQEYGMAGKDFFQQYSFDYERYNLDTWLEDNVLRNIDATIDKKGYQPWYSKWRESLASLPSSMKNTLNQVEIGLQEMFEWEGRSKVYKGMKKGFDDGTLNRDMTLGEARKLNPEIDEWLGADEGWGFHGWHNNHKLGEFYDNRKKRFENTKADMTEDLDEMQDAERAMRLFTQYEEGGFVEPVASLIQQLPHMAPTMLGSILIATGTASTATGVGAAPGLGMIGLGKGLLAIGSGVMAAQVYGTTFIEGTRRQMEEEYGKDGFTTEEYLEALGQEKYGAQLAPLLTAAAVAGTEYFGGKIGAEWIGEGANSIIRSKFGRDLMGKTLSKYVGAAAGTVTGAYIGAAQEGLTEGFQSYIEQVGQNLMNVEGLFGSEAGDMRTWDGKAKGFNSAFTDNISMEQIELEARMGWNMGKLFGIGGMTSSFRAMKKGTILQQARELTEDIDITPGSATGPILESWFKSAKEAINKDPNLNKEQKRAQIQELSNIREAALKIPQNVTGKSRRELLSLLETQKTLKNKIKQVDNKTVSQADGTIGQLNETEARMTEIIENATQIEQGLKGPTVEQSIVPTTSKGKNIDTLAKEYKKKKGDISPDDTNSLFAQYRNLALNALGFDSQKGTVKREDAVSFVDQYMGQILEGWDPAKGALSTYIDATIGPKKSAFYGKEQQLDKKGKETSLADPRAKELQAEEDQEATGEEFQETGSPSSVVAIEETLGHTRPNILAKTKQDIKQFIASSLGKVKEIGKKGKTAITKLTPAAVAKSLVNAAKDSKTRALLKKGMGNYTSNKFKKFVKDAVEGGLIDIIPLATMKKRLGNVPGFNIEKIGRETLGAGTGIYKLSGLEKQALIDYYTDQNVDKSKRQKRYNSLVEVLAEGMALEQFQEMKTDKDFMKDLSISLKEAGSELTAEQFIDELEKKFDKRTPEKRSLDKTESIRSKPKTAQEAAENAIKEIITEENKDKFKDKDVLDRAIEYFEGLDDDFKNTLSANPIQAFIKAIKAALKAIKLILKQGGTLKQAISDGLKILKNELKFLFLSKSKRFVKKLAEKFDFENMESYPDLGAKGELSLRKIFGFEKIDKNSKAYKELRKKEITKFLDSLPPAKREKYRRFLRESMVNNSRTNYNTQAEFDNDFPGPEPKRGENSREKYSTPIFRRLTNKKVELLDSKEFQNEQDAKVDTLIEFFKDIGEYAAKNQESIPVWDSMINDSGNNMQHFIKTHAPIRFYPIDINTGKPDLGISVDEEHSMPSQNVGRILFLAGFTGQMDIISPVIKAGYMQGALLTKEHAKINSREVGLKSSMNEAFNLVFKGLISGDIKQTQQGLSSLIRYTEGNFINPNQYRMAKTGKTIAEQFGVQVEKKYRKAANVIVAQNKAITRILQGENKNKVLKDFKAWGEKLGIMQNTAAKKINKTAHTITDKSQTAAETKETLENSLDTQVNAQKVNKKKKGISVFDLDDTLAKTKEQVLVKMPDGTLRRLTPAQFAEQADQLAEQGAEFDFSQFEDVKGAKKGPLADLALRRQDKFGSGDIYVLTARPQASAENIKLFLDGIGLNIPIENITGLENGSPQAKAQWVLAKTKEGYNDFYFADDSKMNVKAVKQILDQVDVKSKVQQAIADKETSLDKEFNEMLEETEGVKAQAEYSKTRAKLEGQKKDKGFFKWLGKQLTITPSAEDFLGLMYDLMGSGKQGNRHAKWIADNLIDPYNKAEQQILSAKVAVANDFAALKKAFSSLKSTLTGNPLMDEIGVGPYTKSQAIRVYMWTKQGMEIPGLSKRDQNALVKAVESDMELMSFADGVILIQKGKQYPAPGENWVGGTIDSDIMSGIDNTFRREVMTEFDENVDIVFSEKNLLKLEAIYGKKWVDALKDSLRRMKTGSNRPVYQGGGARIVNEMLDWLNGSVGAVMFVNVKSGLLQLISNINFINWGDNNIYAAAKAFASAEYWPTVLKLMNSDYLVNRRDGLKINVNEAELANAAKDRGMKGAIAYLLDKGFIITRIMDSLAIATGGATFYINRRNALLERQNPETGKKYTQAEAEAQAFDDFYAISEESQQSSNPSKISQQQASLFGRVILAFQNVTMQYNRMSKKALRDLYNRRKKPGMTQRESDMSNLSKIVYYTTVQNVVFNALQQTLFAVLFSDETEEEEKDRIADIANGMADSLLFGLGFGGAAISTVKNVLRVVAQESDKKSPDYEEAVWEVFNVSPVLDSKVRKLRTTARTFSWNMEQIKKRGWSLDNPTYLAVSQLVSAATNIPIDRVLRKMMNLRMAMDEETRTWQRVALILGWSSWSLGLPYWGLQSTIDQEEKTIEKAKKDYKNDIRKIKAQGYKKVMYRNLEDFDPKDIVELRTPAGTVVYYVKVGKGKQVKN